MNTLIFICEINNFDIFTFINVLLKTQNPFWEPLETPTLIGVAIVPLESLAYMLDIEEQMIGIYDYQARLVGHLGVCLIPCTEDGREMPEELSVENPQELVMIFFLIFNSSIKDFLFQKQSRILFHYTIY